MQKITLFATLLTVLAACGGSSSDTAKAPSTPDRGVPQALLPLYDSVMAVHDEVMPYHGTLSSTAREMRQQRDSSAHWTERDELALREIGEAEEAMMGWMRQFVAAYEYDGWPEDSLRNYLRDEYRKISDINQQMKGAMETIERWEP